MIRLKRDYTLRAGLRLQRKSELGITPASVENDLVERGIAERVAPEREEQAESPEPPAPDVHRAVIDEHNTTIR